MELQRDNGTMDLLAVLVWASGAVNTPMRPLTTIALHTAVFAAFVYLIGGPLWLVPVGTAWLCLCWLAILTLIEGSGDDESG